ncbi:MAG TPA: PDZ domain-containing protein [Candidatus Krumholzibacteria bacterium]|nr:PDZ domain-containing protein [Candidatus Krumholzibacteria bacterium]
MMKRWNPHVPGAARWIWIALAIVAVAGAAGASERKQDRAREHTSGQSGYIGVYMQDLTDSVRKGLDIDVKRGVLVSGVEDDGPAAAAGLADGDVIVSFNGTNVSTPDELRAAVRETSPGDKVKMDVVQDGKTRAIDVVVGERPDREFGWMWGDSDAPKLHRAFMVMGGGPRLGVQAHELSDELATYFNARPGEGVLVLSVDDESVAEKAGVQPGDVVRKIDEQDIADVDDLRVSLRDFDEGDEFTITVLRHGKTQSLKATMDDQSDHEFSWNFNGHMPDMQRLHRELRGRAPAMQGDDLRRELDEMREELRQMKEKLDSRAD